MAERLEAGLGRLHPAAPHDRVELGKVDRLAVKPADHMDVVRSGREVVAIVDRVRAEHIVVSGQDDDRLMEARELAAHEIDGLVGYAVVIEEVAGDQEQIDLIMERPVDDALEYAPAALAGRGLLPRSPIAVAFEVDVGGVKHSQGTP